VNGGGERRAELDVGVGLEECEASLQQHCCAGERSCPRSAAALAAVGVDEIRLRRRLVGREGLYRSFSSSELDIRIVRLDSD